jgi:hypothetical protein
MPIVMVVMMAVFTIFLPVFTRMALMFRINGGRGRGI